MAYSLRRFSKQYIQYKTNLSQRIQNISTTLCVLMNVINPFFNKTFKRFTELLYSIVDMMANVAVNVQKLWSFASKVFQALLFSPHIIGAITMIWDQVLEWYIISYKAVANTL